MPPDTGGPVAGRAGRGGWLEDVSPQVVIIYAAAGSDQPSESPRAATRVSRALSSAAGAHVAERLTAEVRPIGSRGIMTLDVHESSALHHYLMPYWGPSWMNAVCRRAGRKPGASFASEGDPLEYPRAVQQVRWVMRGGVERFSSLDLP